jgi:hypothetical protein
MAVPIEISLAEKPLAVDKGQFHPGHYVFVASKTVLPLDVLINQDIVGVKIKYHWRDLETAFDTFDFSEIEKDLALLQSRNKRLWIQISWVQFGGNQPPLTPSYMWTEPAYGGSPPYHGSYARTVQDGGWYPIYWNSNVRRRMVRLFEALGDRFGNEEYIEGISIQETAAGQTADFDCVGLQQTLREVALAAKSSFAGKSVFQMINFACFDLVAHASWMSSKGIGLGTPDMHAFKDYLTRTVYPLFLRHHSTIPTGPDIQWDNYDRNNMSVRELLDFTISTTNPWYLFWTLREPVFSDEVMPTIHSRKLPAAEAFYAGGEDDLRPNPPALTD